MCAAANESEVNELDQSRPTQPRALVMADRMELTHALLEVLADAGFAIDCVSIRVKNKQLGHIDRFYYESSYGALLQRSVALAKQHSYAVVAASNDKVLKCITDAELPDADKLLLLPVTGAQHLHHLASKVGLSHALSRHGVPTPEFAVAHDAAGLHAAAARVGYPLVVKGDFSGGGNQVFKCVNADELTRVARHFRAYPALLQQFIDGELASIEAFFQQGQLLHFAYSEVLEYQCDQRFAPSSLRRFLRRDQLAPGFEADLENLGHALGANGFANVTAIRTPGGQHYFFEADMRPTVWIGYPRLFGDSLAAKMARHFGIGAKPNKPPAPADHASMIFCYPPRLPLWKIVFNRHRAWEYCRTNPYLARLVLRKLKLDLLAILNLRRLRHALRA